MTYYLGLTGSIGMGKSTTAQMFRDEGIPVWDADAAVHELYTQDPAAIAEIGSAFPAAVIDKMVSRDALKQIIADDPQALSGIEKIIHPLVAQHRQHFIDRHNASILVFDIPLLYETGGASWLDSVLVVTAPADVQKARVLARLGMTAEQFNLILSRQIPDAEKRARADHIIETLTLDGTRADVRNLIAELKRQQHA
ncbi:dephospho-CoA kinase [Loktanella agnita]|uniref:dephospho-CoA kinase n=1 Tax=Loktanella agnita TaxID=287097 RepID=UPI003986AAE5